MSKPGARIAAERLWRGPFAQVTSGTIFGSVKDPSGAFVPQAKVTATNASEGITRTVTSNEEGGFVLPNLAPGTYAITVEAAGFKKLEKTGLISPPPIA